MIDGDGEAEPDGEDGEDGPAIDGDGDGKAEPVIRIYRPSCDVRDPMLDGIATVVIEAELWTLAHECGHFLWWKQGWDGDAEARAERCDYFAALRYYEAVEKALAKEVRNTLTDTEYTRRLGASMQRELSTEEHRLILEEERRAWNLGRDLLQLHGVEDLTHYNERAVDGVNHYLVRLGHVRVDG